VGRTIADSNLRENDINVLTLYRGSTVIPNPKNSRVLQPGDRLLCFGKLELMRDLIPPKTRKKRSKKVRHLPDLPVADEVLDVAQASTESKASISSKASSKRVSSKDDASE